MMPGMFSRRGGTPFAEHAFVENVGLFTNDRMRRFDRHLAMEFSIRANQTVPKPPEPSLRSSVKFLSFFSNTRYNGRVTLNVSAGSASGVFGSLGRLGFPASLPTWSCVSALSGGS